RRVLWGALARGAVGFALLSFVATFAYLRCRQRRASLVILDPEVGDLLLATQVAQRVLQLHQLNEEVVFWIERRSAHRTLEVERQPLLDSLHARTLRQVEKKD